MNVCDRSAGSISAAGVRDALTCPDAERPAPASHVCETRARLSQAYYRIENGILPVLDIDALFDLGSRRARAAGHSEIRPRRDTTNGADTCRKCCSSPIPR